MSIKASAKSIPPNMPLQKLAHLASMSLPIDSQRVFAAAFAEDNSLAHRVIVGFIDASDAHTAGEFVAALHEYAEWRERRE